jgi:phosphoribosylglycinamide formyltransferase 1
MKRLAVLISSNSSGSNLQAIIDAIRVGSLQATICIVIATKETAPGLTKAKAHNLKIAICEKKETLLPLLQTYKPDFICLAGWQQIITDNVLNEYPEKIVNIHPGLIPSSLTDTVKNPDGSDALWNKQKYGNAAIENFLNHNALYAGSSIHFLTKEFDFGPVLGRTFEAIYPDDTVDTLYERLKKKEHVLYIDALKRLCNR